MLFQCGLSIFESKCLPSTMAGKYFYGDRKDFLILHFLFTFQTRDFYLQVTILDNCILSLVSVVKEKKLTFLSTKNEAVLCSVLLHKLRNLVLLIT